MLSIPWLSTSVYNAKNLGPVSLNSLSVSVSYLYPCTKISESLMPEPLVNTLEATKIADTRRYFELLLSSY